MLKVVSEGDTDTFKFSGPSGNVSVTTTGSPNGTGQSGSMSVAPGKYAWTISKALWKTRYLDCTDRDAGPFEQRSTVSGSTATFNVQSGETVTCTWTMRH